MWAVISRFINKDTATKVSVVWSGEPLLELHTLVGKEWLPQELGGTRIDVAPYSYG
jgi:hypothetical protein